MKWEGGWRLSLRFWGRLDERWVVKCEGCGLVWFGLVDGEGLAVWGIRGEGVCRSLGIFVDGR